MTVLGFPCNQFGAQEPGTNEEIHAFAREKYDANFPMFAKIEVNGAGAEPLYEWLKSVLPDPDGKADIKWNFTKFLVNKQGVPVKRFEPMVTPDQIAAELASLL